MEATSCTVSKTQPLPNLSQPSLIILDYDIYHKVYGNNVPKANKKNITVLKCKNFIYGFSGSV